MLLLNIKKTHLTFEILLNLNVYANYSITKESELRRLLKVIKIFIWDEIPMTNKAVFEVVDKLLCDIISVDQRFDKKNNVYWREIFDKYF